MTDFTVLLQSMPDGNEGLEKIVEFANKASSEDKRILYEECEIMMECRTCRNIFRSAQILVNHKARYCGEGRAAVVAVNGGQIEEGSGEREDTTESATQKKQIQKKLSKKEKLKLKEKEKEEEEEKMRAESKKEEDNSTPEEEAEKKEPAPTMDLHSTSRTMREAPITRLTDGTKKIVGALPCHLAAMDLLPEKRTPIAHPQDNLSRYQTMQRLTAVDPDQSRVYTNKELKIMEYMEEKDIRCANIENNKCEHPSCKDILHFHSLEALAFHCTVHHMKPIKNKDDEKRWTCLLCYRDVASIEAHLNKNHSKVKEEHSRKRKEEMKKSGNGRQDRASYRSRSLSIDRNAKMTDEEDDDIVEIVDQVGDVRIVDNGAIGDFTDIKEDEDAEDRLVLNASLETTIQEDEKSDMEMGDAKKGEEPDEKNKEDLNNEGWLENAESSTSKTSIRSAMEKKSEVGEEKKAEPAVIEIPSVATSSVQLTQQPSSKLSGVIDRIAVMNRRNSHPSQLPTDENIREDVIDQSGEKEKIEEGVEQKMDGKEKKNQNITPPTKNEADPEVSKISKKEDTVKRSEKREEEVEKSKKDEDGKEKKVLGDNEGKVTIVVPVQTNGFVPKVPENTSAEEEEKPTEKKEEKEVTRTTRRSAGRSVKEGEGSSAETDKNDDGEAKTVTIAVPTKTNGLVAEKQEMTSGEEEEKPTEKRDNKEVTRTTRRSVGIPVKEGEGLSAEMDKKDDGEAKKVTIAVPTKTNGLVSNVPDKTAAEEVKTPSEKKEDKEVTRTTRRSVGKRVKEGAGSSGDTDKKDDGEAKKTTVDEEEKPTEKKEEKEVTRTTRRSLGKPVKEDEFYSKTDKNNDGEERHRVTIVVPTKTNGLVSKEPEKTTVDEEEKPTEKKEEKEVGRTTRRSRMPSKSGEGSSAEIDKNDDGETMMEKVTVILHAQTNGLVSKVPEKTSPEVEEKSTDKKEENEVTRTTPRSVGRPVKEGERSSAETDKKDEGETKKEIKKKASSSQVSGTPKEPKKMKKGGTRKRRMTMTMEEETIQEEKEDEEDKKPRTPRRTKSVVNVGTTIGESSQAEANEREIVDEGNSDEKKVKEDEKRAPTRKPRRTKSVVNVGTTIGESSQAETNEREIVDEGNSDEKKEPKKRGRPRKSFEEKAEDQDEVKEPITPKVGRPKKKVDEAGTSKEQDDMSGEKDETEIVKRKRGRPSKESQEAEEDKKKKSDKDDETTEGAEKNEESTVDDNEKDSNLTTSGRVRKRPQWMTTGDYDETKKNEQSTSNVGDGQGTSTQEMKKSEDIKQPTEKKAKKDEKNKNSTDQTGSSSIPPRRAPSVRSRPSV